jgi:hypothetical protein
MHYLTDEQQRKFELLSDDLKARGLNIDPEEIYRVITIPLRTEPPPFQTLEGLVQTGKPPRKRHNRRPGFRGC